MHLPLVLAISLAGAPAPGNVEVLPAETPTRVSVLAGLTPAMADLPAGALDQDRGETILRFALVDEESGRTGPAMFGSYQRRGGVLVFTPRYALSHDRLYRATFVAAAGNERTADYRVPPRPPSTPARVEQVYPSGDQLPANILKFYVQFSKPMREGGDLFERFSILDADGKPVADPWRRTELWTADARRLTLSIHPGRIKQGVNLREELGPVLEPGRKYTLVVDAGLLDADGQPLAKPYTKTFQTTAEDRERPIPSAWKLKPPQQGTRDPLHVSFGEALDQALLGRYLKLWDGQERRLAGKIEIGAGESTWSFTPEAPWSSGRHTLSVEEELEDVAGNTPLRLFDTDLSLPSPAPPVLRVPFSTGR